MRVDRRLVQNVTLVGITCAVMGIVLHVSAHGRAFVLAGSRPIDLIAELFLAAVAGAGALVIASTSTRLLVVTASIMFLLEELASPAAPNRYVFAFGLAAPGLAWGCLAAARAADGRRRTIEWAANALLAIGAVSTGVLAALAWQPDHHGCNDCPANVFALFDSSRWSGDFARWGAVTMLVGAALALEPVVRRRRLTDQVIEQVFLVAFSIGLTIALLPRVRHAAGGFASPAARLVEGMCLAVSALALAFPDLQQLRRRAAIRKLATRLAAAPAPGRLRAELARAVGDPDVSLAFPVGDGALVDSEGLPVHSTGRAATTIMRDGRHLATVFHAPGTFDDDGEVAALTRVAGLVIEHERARAELQAQGLELRASRRRLVEASDRERRRLEHDLHDGAQQQLVSLLVALAGNPATAAARTLTAAEQHVQAAITKLRTLTHGLFPSVLTNEGLGPAIEDLEMSSSTIVEILELPTQRAPTVVESTAYLAAALAVASAEAAIQLRVRSSTESVVVEALGASASDSLEWRALSERVAALDGRIDTSSNSVKVTLPCVS